MVGRKSKYAEPATKQARHDGESQVDSPDNWENDYETEFGLAEDADELMQFYDEASELEGSYGGSKEPVVEPAEANDGMSAFEPGRPRSPFDHDR
ncbi:MAG: hypothetical protein MUP63_02435 [Candidatus Nanohaloarchaeota archaeon QJJ-7]|nr:hypothetical protein [Candidatus Nanohaloarchaeota archaeon QJJ-7]